jgi:hypothetical protein
LGAGLDAPFDKTLIELGLVPFPSLLGIANHTGEVKRIALTEVEHVAGDSPSGIGSLVAHLLTLRLNPNSIRIQRRVLRAESPKRSVVVPKVVLVVLSKREHLDARFAFDGGEATHYSTCNTPHLNGPLCVEAEPNCLGFFYESVEPLFHEMEIIILTVIVVNIIVIQTDVVGWVCEDARDLINPVEDFQTVAVI